MKRMLAEFEKIQTILMAFPHEFGDCQIQKAL